MRKYLVDGEKALSGTERPCRFHSASVNGVRSERGNEFIKDRFYNGLEVWKYISGYKALSKEAQDALLAASPNGMLWLTPQIAKTLGIDYEDWPPRKKPTP
jgi:hypothetical protein